MASVLWHFLLSNSEVIYLYTDTAVKYQCLMASGLQGIDGVFAVTKGIHELTNVDF